MRVRAISTGYTGGPGIATFHFATSTAPQDNAAAVLACDRVRDAYTAGKAVIPGVVTVSVSAAVDEIDEATGTLTGTLSGNASSVAGDSTDNSIGPAPSGLLATWLTGGVAGTHRVKGRTFLVPVPKGAADVDGTPTALALSRVALFAGAMNSPGATDVIFGVYSRPFAGKIGIPARAGTFHGCTGYTVPDEFVVLRSRRD